jgi:hypothetical protein
MRYDDEYRVVQKKRGGFWPFVGGLILGAVAVKTIQEMSKKEDKNKTTTDSQDDVKLIKDLILELVLKENKTPKDEENLRNLKNKLKQING